jgi:hypothetical protein
MYVIRNINNKNLFWSNDWGWGSYEGCVIFNEHERRTLNLVDEGYWIELWDVNALQFARLIAEAEAMGVWTTAIIGALAEEMDLENDEVCSLISRAQADFDQAKEKI